MRLGSTVVALGTARRIAWVGGFFIAAIVALATYDIHTSHQAAVANANRELETQARVIAEQTARSLQAVDVVLRHLAEQSRRGALAAMSDRELHNYLREQAIGLVQVEGLLVVERSGLPRAVSMRYPLPERRDLSGFPMFQELRAKPAGRMLVGPVLQSDVDGVWVIPMGRRVESPAGEFAGAVGARGKVDYFQQFYADLRFEPGTRVTLMHDDGTLVARHPAEAAALGKHFPLYQKILAEHGGTRPVRARSPIDGIERFGSLKPVPDYPLAVVVSRDVDLALAPWRAQALGTAFRTLALSALAAALLVLLMRQVSRLQGDIDARKRAEDALRASEEQYRAVFDATTDALILRDGEGRIVDVNPAWVVMNGMTREEALSDRARVFASPDKHEQIREYYRRARNGETIHYQLDIERKGGVAHLDVRIVPVLYRGERHSLSLARDITAQKRAEEALKSSEEQYRSIFNAAADALVLRDAEARVVDVNPAFLEMSGFTREEVVGDKRWIFAAPEAAHLAGEMHRRVIAGESVQAEITARRKDGRAIDIEMRAAPVLYRGKPHALGMARDITAQKKAAAERAQLEGQLLQSKKLEAIGTLAGGIAHDFNNILAAILGYGDLAQKSASARPGTALRRHIDAVVSAGLRAKSLVERILAFSRSGMGARVAVHVQSVVSEALDLAAPSLPANVRLERQLAAGDATVMGDATQIHQVVMNLCANAIQAMKSGGTVTVALDVVERGEAMAATSKLAAGRYVRLAVRDTGVGIAAGVLERIFDPFFTTREVGVGTGLGLSLVHGIVTDLGGGIDVESRPGEGTAFSVYLPWSSAVAARAPVSENVPLGEGETILLVDDEEALVRLGEEVIASLGYEPVGFTSSTEALAAFRASPQRFQAVLSDEAMPDMTGAQLAKEIRALRPDMPIVLMSGYVSPAFTARAREIGVAEVLAKPLVAHEIARSLAGVLRKEPSKETSAMRSS